MSQQDETGVVMEAAPRSALEMVQAQFFQQLAFPLRECSRQVRREDFELLG